MDTGRITGRRRQENRGGNKNTHFNVSADSQLLKQEAFYDGCHVCHAQTQKLSVNLHTHTHTQGSYAHKPVKAIKIQATHTEMFSHTQDTQQESFSAVSPEGAEQRLQCN